MLDREGHIPLYRQIADIIGDRITRGELSPGEPIPSETELKREYGVAQMTARRVHRELRERGLIHTVPGEGSFVGPAGTPRAEYLAPLYRKIADQVAGGIQDGRIPANRPIPSERNLMLEHGVAKATIRQAISLLRTEGWVFTVPYRGTFAAPPESWPARAR
ncbi:GntR family transcriptional regulator [Acrocarpospora catenulata]|uniref:GntR family transcriptional regulator n=1 Tax=Acrocarpospora catenulata TaxID=2836182 RepID=UPI001BDB483E|nr:GntR family transcriptional regulator [Acrocarpospora catenulata]